MWFWCSGRLDIFPLWGIWAVESRDLACADGGIAMRDARKARAMQDRLSQDCEEDRETKGLKAPCSSTQTDREGKVQSQDVGSRNSFGAVKARHNCMLSQLPKNSFPMSLVLQHARTEIFHSHPKHPKPPSPPPTPLTLFKRSHRSPQPQPQNPPRMRRRYNPIIPQPRR